MKSDMETPGSPPSHDGAEDLKAAASPYNMGKVTRHSTARLVAEALLRFIRDNHLQKGDRLPPTVRLAGMLGVSLATLREGLKELEAYGIVSAQQGRGVFVESDRLDLLVRPAPFANLYPLEPAEVMDLMEARRLIEVETARLAAERAGPAQLDRMQALLEMMRAGKERPDEFIQHDMEFHMVIAESSGNVVYPRLLTAVRETFLVQQRMAVELPGAADRACRYHDQVYQAMARRDGRNASRAMAEHLEDIKIHLARALEATNDTPVTR
ncbi:FadR/GntR family transcriptional regulator [Geochorda subterranea]|uniref:FadR/GntR family transcriptional regulator n=1 Tax=Geochorda subterranea TaxID=3109564 RepID=A0ABZ1BQC5_9FIRM|nr:FadR/GntR family transcriptional regulator [Limnochorda sp. LNt]WRP15010.1 FadR/GntR family transcriptional regulator [Limnochorda sp. LNt]